MGVKEELHKLVEALPEGEAEDALEYLRWLLGEGDHLTDRELAGMRQGEEQIARGEWEGLEKIKRDIQ